MNFIKYLTEAFSGLRDPKTKHRIVGLLDPTMILFDKVGETVAHGRVVHPGRLILGAIALG